MDEPDLKPPMQSKKFVAFLVSEVTWKVIVGLILVLGMKNASVDLMVGSIILACVLIAGFVEVTYIGKQSDLDKYTRLAMMGIKETASGLRGKEPSDAKTVRPDRENVRE